MVTRIMVWYQGVLKYVSKITSNLKHLKILSGYNDLDLLSHHQDLLTKDSFYQNQGQYITLYNYFQCAKEFIFNLSSMIKFALEIIINLCYQGGI